VRVWREAVERDLSDAPVAPEELHAAGLTTPTADDLMFGYGATLILAVVAAGWLLCAQIGDGDVLAVTETGAVLRPVPADPRLDGSRTTSLCQPDAADALRYGVLNVSDAAIAAVMLATDGYGNAQARNDWDTAFGTDLAALAATHGADWLGRQLPGWVRQCASSNGSGDDVTVALVLAADAGWRPAPQAVADRTTVVNAMLPATDRTVVVDDRTVVADSTVLVDRGGPVVPPPGRPVTGDDMTVPYAARPPLGDDTTVLHPAFGAPPSPSPLAPQSPPPPAMAPAAVSPAPYAAPVAPARTGLLAGTTRETLLLVALAAIAAVGAVVLVVLLVG
jgi:hypothetical protein